MGSGPVSNVFVRACAEGRLSDVRAMLIAGEDPDQIDHGIPDLEEGAITSWGWDGYEPNSMGRNGLEMALRTQNLALLELLDEYGADFRFPKPHVFAGHPDGDGGVFPKSEPFNCLLGCAMNGFFEGFKYVIEQQKQDMPSEEEEKEHLLYWAADGGSLLLTQHLLQDHDYSALLTEERSREYLEMCVREDAHTPSLLRCFLKNKPDLNYDTYEKVDNSPNKVADPFGIFDGLDEDPFVLLLESYKRSLLGRVLLGALINQGRDRDVFDMYKKKAQILASYGADPEFKDMKGVAPLSIFEDVNAEVLGFLTPDFLELRDMVIQAYETSLKGQECSVLTFPARPAPKAP